MNDHHTTTTQLIALDTLATSPLNARRTVRKDGIDELKASILAHGLMQNLVVTAASGGSFQVIAGGRRLQALQSLQAEGNLPADYAVPCQIASEDHAREMSLAENVVRLAMHPADQFESFAGLIEQGHTAAQVGERFGVEESLVLKRMKLGRVAPGLLKEYRKDAISLECLMAFTVTDDRKRQLAVYKSLRGWQKEDPRHIRACLTESMIDAGSKLARLVGLDAYAAAGGTTRADLFGDDVYLENPELLHQLATDKLDGIRLELESEGWNWVEIAQDRDHQFIGKCGRIQPALIDAPEEVLVQHRQAKATISSTREALRLAEEESAIDDLTSQLEAAEEQLEQIELQLSAHVGFAAEQMTLAGCCVSIGHDGTPFIDKGLVRPEQKRQLAKLLGGDAADIEPAKPDRKDRMPESLRRDLAAARQQAAQAEIARHPAIAFDLLAFQAASSTLGNHPVIYGPDLIFRKQPLAIGEDTAAGMAMEEIRQSLPTGWLKEKSEARRFEAFRRLSEAEKHALLAYSVASTLKPSLAPAAGHATAYDVALSLTAASMAGYWRPAAGNFLGRVTREQLLAIGRDTIGETWSQSRHGDKKKSLVEQLDRAFSDPEKHGRTPEQVEKLKSWLPAGMAFGIVAAGKPVKAKKSRKAA